MTDLFCSCFIFLSLFIFPFSFANKIFRWNSTSIHFIQIFTNKKFRSRLLCGILRHQVMRCNQKLASKRSSSYRAHLIGRARREKVFHYFKCFIVKDFEIHSKLWVVFDRHIRRAMEKDRECRGFSMLEISIGWKCTYRIILSWNCEFNFCCAKVNVGY